jgi:hypothetical protein
MPNTYSLIASSTVGAGGAANIDFSSIPSAYTDLCLKVSLRDTNAGAAIDGGIRLNGATTNYTWRQLRGNGAAASSSAGTTDTLIYAWIHDGAGATASTFADIDIYIPNYAGSSAKSISFDGVQENNATTAWGVLSAGLWNSTAAVNQVTIVTAGTAFAQHSTAYLYGIIKS